MERPNHWWLRTEDFRPVFRNEQGHYTLTWESGYVNVEYTEGQSGRPDKEAWAQEISAKVGIACDWIFQPK